jgi:hypothetical protein
MPLERAPTSPGSLVGWTTISDPATHPSRFPFHEARATPPAARPEGRASPSGSAAAEAGAVCTWLPGQLTRRVSTSPDTGESWPSQALRRCRSGRLLLSESDRAPPAERRDPWSPRQSPAAEASLRESTRPDPTALGGCSHAKGAASRALPSRRMHKPRSVVPSARKAG